MSGPKGTRTPLAPRAPAVLDLSAMRQEIHFCTSADGTRIAYGVHGSGPVLVHAAHWLTHLEYDWESPVWRHWRRDLGERFTVIRYDERGSGLSDRNVREQSTERWLEDLEAVVNHARAESFSLLGVSAGGHLAIRYAAKHPQRVQSLIVYGAYLRGVARRNSEHGHKQVDLYVSLIREGWGGTKPAFRRFFTNLFIPEARAEQVRWFDELQLRSTDAANAIVLRRVRSEIDVTQEARAVRVPTLVMHLYEDGVVPFDEGRLVAATIDGARFVPLQGRNHIILEEDHAWSTFLIEVESFVASTDGGPDGKDSGPMALGALSSRELEVLRSVAEGRSNSEIAKAMFLSERTVERHLSNIYVKLGVTGKAARAASAAAYSRLQTRRSR
jgi:pimeloyl-ACP methyl ester carboxylesterase/DNA-binding CsgD family transcriptional regulator